MKVIYLVSEKENVAVVLEGYSGRIWASLLRRESLHVMLPNARIKTLLPIIQEKVEPDSIVDTDRFKACNALDIPDFHYRRINHSKLFADKQNHINGIESSWNQA